MDPVWISIALSGLAALLAAVAAVRPLSDARLAASLDELQRDVGVLRTVLSEELARGREESGREGRHLREELGANTQRLGTLLRETVERLGAGQGERVEKVAEAVRGLAEETERRLGEMRRSGDEAGQKLREEVGAQVRGLGDLLSKSLSASAASQKERLDEVGDALRRLMQSNAEANEALRTKVETRLDLLRQENGLKLEEMRRTVDEKLQGTLEERLGEKFKIVSHHLEQVHRSVGEMQNLASGVGDLKRVLTNVKSRGTWAEVSLGVLLEQALTPEQFDRNVETVRGSGERVEFAVRFPGPTEGEAVWLPIDAKFPVEDYERLLEASERADPAAVEAALKGLETRIRLEGAKICGKYVAPPETTDFAIMYLPTEGLYAEILRRPGLVDHLQTQCRIMVAGPTNLHAFLNSLRMGFRTLAVEKRSSEVWKTLSEVKVEFGKYGEVLDAVKKKLHEASNQIEKVGVRKRAIDRKLRDVELLPEPSGPSALPLESLLRDADDLLDAAE